MIPQKTKRRLRDYLREDLASGDITTGITPARQCTAIIRANEDCTLAGIEETVFLCKQTGLWAKALKKDGSRARKGQKILLISGNNRKILSIERVCLNILGRMSGVATLCSEAKEQILAGAKRRGAKNAARVYSLPIIAVTRKTVPGFQLLDKKAAQVAGCWTHRKDLAEMILLKDNHLKFFPSVLDAAQKAKKTGKKFEVEVETELEAFEAMLANPDIIMLDNFTPQMAKKTVHMLRVFGHRGKIELSGGITLKNLKKYSELGADIISMGELTKKARIVDFSLDIGEVK